MLSLIKQVFIVLLSFSSSLARGVKICDQTQYMSLNDETCLVRPTLLIWILLSLNINHLQLAYINVVEVVMSYLQKYVFQKKTKNVNVDIFNMIANKNEAKTMAKHISCDFKHKFNSITCNSNHKLNNKTCQCGCKNYRKC